MYYRHGDTGTRLYRIWKSMKCRCLTKNHPTYTRYGARGITICPEWRESYPVFKEWAMNNGYEETLELDRVNVDGNYCPENCRWISHHEQTLNRRDTLYIVIDGRIEKFRDFCIANHLNLHTVSQWRHKGIEEQKIAERIGKPVVVRQRREVVGNATS